MRGALLIAAAVLLGAGLLANGFSDDHSILSKSGPTPTTKKSSTTTPTSAPVVQAQTVVGPGFNSPLIWITGRSRSSPVWSLASRKC